jgi:hypothetical protein
MEVPEKPSMVITTDDSVDHTAPGSIIYIDPEKEAAVLRKFDLFVLPVSVVFLVLSTLDRNNVSSVPLFSQGLYD